MRVYIAHGMKKFFHLRTTGFHNSRIRMPRCRDAKRRRQIKIPFAIRIPDMNTFRSLPDNRPGTIRFHKSDIPRFVIAKNLENLPGFLHAFFCHGFARMHTEFL